ncbi:Membrane anchor Opy2 N-terminal [Penicillium riverlandense]|uniref:Membrane anchor Opy2 N-terminal n=1 Tax=Penicillium riverlandense TaxID=1903569 RepID=UPI002547FDD8|nr:Membrane anchor Opy2 N-terminal [Penicillium riverlandense]KAJ5818057.1 Membrane anchor Opy2 N-terminal [Penicillium riverlandense]
MLLEPVYRDFLTLNGLTRRSVDKCKPCPTSAPPCPACPEGTQCQQIIRTCTECASSYCQKIPGSDSTSSGSSSNSSSGGSDTGAIAGGVIAGVVAVGIIVFLIWWFVIRKKRQERESEKNSDFDARRNQRKSVQSIASTVLTRASNVIQIAYIPGHFFMPGDLRDSAWTQATGHQSFSPTLRSSVATTIYRNDAIVSAQPAQQVARSRANVVSIHTASNPSTPGLNAPGNATPVVVTPSDAPAVPAITPAQLAKADAIGSSGTLGPAGNSSSSIVARTVMAKPVMVRGASLKKKESKPDTSRSATTEAAEASNGVMSGDSSPASHQFTHDTSTFDGNSSDEEDGYRVRPPAHSPSPAPPAIPELEAPSDGPFHDQASIPTEATSSGSKRQSGSTLGHRHRHSASSSRNNQPALKRVESPFSDANEVS